MSAFGVISLPPAFRSKHYLLILRCLYKQFVTLVTALEEAPSLGCGTDDFELTVLEL